MAIQEIWRTYYKSRFKFQSIKVFVKSKMRGVQKMVQHVLNLVAFFGTFFNVCLTILSTPGITGLKLKPTKLPNYLVKMCSKLAIQKLEMKC